MRAGIGIAAGGEKWSDLSDEGAPIGRYFAFEAQITPAIPVATQDLAKIVVGGGMSGLLPERQG